MVEESAKVNQEIKLLYLQLEEQMNHMLLMKYIKN